MDVSCWRKPTSDRKRNRRDRQDSFGPEAGIGAGKEQLSQSQMGTLRVQIGEKADIRVAWDCPPDRGRLISPIIIALRATPHASIGGITTTLVSAYTVVSRHDHSLRCVKIRSALGL